MALFPKNDLTKTCRPPVALTFQRTPVGWLPSPGFFKVQAIVALSPDRVSQDGAEVEKTHTQT